jgi:3',5'-cyclic AMP phosphodiesterase CpdA
MLLAQISDLHVTTPGAPTDGLYRTPEHLARAVAHLIALPRRPDAVVVTGDLVERGDPEEYERLVDLLWPLPMPVYVIPGNHDRRETLACAFADRGYLPRSGFLQYTIDEHPLRLVALDTHVPGKAHGELCADRLAWVDARLRERPDQPTVVMLHHPPFRTGLPAMDAMGLRGGDELAAIVARHPQVERVIGGHLHRTIVRRFAGTVASTCPGTAHQIALDLEPEQRLATILEPPACALHLWTGGALVSHTSVIGSTERPVCVLYDGHRWLGEPDPPEGW